MKGTTTAIVGVLTVLLCLLVLLPLALELVFTLCDAAGVPWRTSRAGVRAAISINTCVHTPLTHTHLLSLSHTQQQVDGSCACRVSDYAELGVAAATMGMVILPIYLHFVEYVPFWQRTAHDDYWELVVYHVAPSLWINIGIFYFFYKVCVRLLLLVG